MPRGPHLVLEPGVVFLTLSPEQRQAFQAIWGPFYLAALYGTPP